MGDELQKEERVMEKDKFALGTGQAHELAMAFGRNGWTNADVKRLSVGDILAQILLVVRGEAEVGPLGAAREMTIGDVTYEVISPLEGKETEVIGYAVADRARVMGANFDRIEGHQLGRHRDEIPAVFRNLRFIFGPTVPGGSLEFFGWSRGLGWYWDSCPFDTHLDGCYRLIRRKAAQASRRR